MKDSSSCTFHPPEAHAWVFFVGCHAALLFGGGVPIAIWAYYWGRRHVRSCLILAVLVAASIPLYLHHHAGNNDTTRTLHSMAWAGSFLANTFAFSTAFKLWNVAFQQYPEGADVSLRVFVMWFLLLPEPQFVKGKTRTLSTAEVKGILWRPIPKLLALSVMLSILTTSTQDLHGEDKHKTLLHRFMDPFLPTQGETIFQEVWNGFLHLWWLYLFVSSLLELSVIASLPLTDCQAMEDCFRHPLVESRSLAEFWGSRWNIPVHRLLQRTVYIPMRKQGFARPLAVLGTFLVSGLLHEYNFWTHNYVAYHQFGIATLFFLGMGLGMLLEHSILTMPASNSIGEPPSKHGIPTLFIALGYTLLSAVPVERYFIKSWLEAGMIESVAPLFPHVTCR